MNITSIEEKEKFYYQNVLNPYPSDSQSEAAYKKGFYDAWDKFQELINERDKVKNFEAASHLSNRAPNAQASVARDADSSNTDDPIKI